MHHDMNIPILYEDDDVVVIDKPSGVMVHGDGRSPRTKGEKRILGASQDSLRTFASEAKSKDPMSGQRQYGARETVADWHVARVPTARGVGEPMVLANGVIVDRPGVVHRLDQETSGVLILAKTQEAFVHLKKQFHDRLTKKEYRAFVYGQVKEPRGIITRAIGRSAQDFRLRSAQRGARGTLREAETAWERITAMSDYSYLRLLPRTGRTHQLRVHAKAMNHPIVHDRLYAPKRVEKDPQALGFARLALHAYALTVTLPAGETKTFTAPLPEDFRHAETLLSDTLA